MRKSDKCLKHKENQSLDFYYFLYFVLVPSVYILLTLLAVKLVAVNYFHKTFNLLVRSLMRLWNKNQTQSQYLLVIYEKFLIIYEFWRVICSCMSSSITISIVRDCCVVKRTYKCTYVLYYYIIVFCYQHLVNDCHYTHQEGLNKKEIRLNLCNIFSILLFNELA